MERNEKLVVDRYSKELLLAALKRIRGEAGFSQAKLATAMGVTKARVAVWEQGRGRMTDFELGNFLLQCGSSRAKIEKEMGYNG